MRRLVFSIIVASGLVLVGAGSASAAPTPAAGAVKAVPGKKVCKVSDPRLDELSGLIATKNGFITVDDSATESSHKRIFYLDNSCQVVNAVKYSGDGPRDTEDMALSPDGKTLWVGDIGDNNKERGTIGLWKMPADGSQQPTLYRLRYPTGDGPYDAEGLVINGDGNPVVITKQPGTAGIYVPAGALKPGPTDGTPMKRVGEFKLPSTTTANPLGPLGRLVVTGAAVSPDRSKLVIRTYADAFEFPISDDDVPAAVKNTATQTALPNEPQGESITYSSDGKSFYTVSDMQGNTTGRENDILRYTPTAAVATAKSAGAGGGSGSTKPGFFSSLTLDDITYLVGGVGVIGAVLVGLGIFGIIRARRRPPGGGDLGGSGDDYPDGPRPRDAATELLTVGPNSRGPVYGSQQQQSGPVYGGKRSGGPQQPGGYGPGGGRPGGPGVRPGQPTGRPPQGGGRPPQSGQPTGRPPQGGGRPPQGGQPNGRPGPAQGGQPGRGGVYGAPPSGPPPGRGGQGGPSQRSSGYHPDGGRQTGQGGYADVNGVPRGRDHDNPGYGRRPYEN